MNGGWQKLAFWLIGILATLSLGWTASQSADDKTQDERLSAAEENIRNIHYEKQIDREILNRIDKNTGGNGDAPEVRPLREVR